MVAPFQPSGGSRRRSFNKHTRLLSGLPEPLSAHVTSEDSTNLSALPKPAPERRAGKTHSAKLGGPHRAVEGCGSLGGHGGSFLPGPSRRRLGPDSGGCCELWARCRHSSGSSSLESTGYAYLFTVRSLCSCCMWGTRLGSGDMLSQTGCSLCYSSLWEKPQRR